MKNRNKISYGPIQVVAILAAFTVAQPALSDCVQSDPPADTILDIDANSGCANIQDQEGCTIDKVADGTCTYTDPTDEKRWFKVDSYLNLDGSLSWDLDPLSTIKGIDTAVIGGGAGGKNNCGYIYNSDVASGSGGDCKGDIDDFENCDGAFQNITGLAVCTDGIDDVAPPPPEVAENLAFCSDPLDPSAVGDLDETGIRCPIDEDPDSPTYGQQKPVVVCNFEKDKADWGTTDGSDVCCQCGIALADQTACIVTEDGDRQNCEQTMTVNPTQSVELLLFKDDEDPCTWLRTAKGWKQWCY